MFRGRDVLAGARDAIERLRNAEIPFRIFYQRRRRVGIGESEGVER